MPSLFLTHPLLRTACLPSTTQCRERWNNHLAPGINRGEWTSEEEAALVEAHKAFGNRWAAIAARLPGRTENSVKNHWNATLRRKLRGQGSPVVAVSAGGDGQAAAPASPALAVTIPAASSVLHEYILALSLTAQDRSSTKRGLSASPSISGWAEEEEEQGGGGSAPTRRSLSSNQLCISAGLPVETTPVSTRPVRQSRLVAEASIAAVAAAEAAGELGVDDDDDLLPARQARRTDVFAAARGKKAARVEVGPNTLGSQADHLAGGSLAGAADALLPWSMTDMDDLLGGPHTDWFSLDLALMDAPWSDPTGDMTAAAATGAAAGAAAAWNLPPLAMVQAPVEPAAAAGDTLGRSMMCASETSRPPVSPGTPTDAASVITPGGTCSVVGPSHSAGEVAQGTLLLLDSATSPKPRQLLGDARPLDLSLIGEELMASDFDWAADMAQAVGLLEPAHELRVPPLRQGQPASRHCGGAPPVASRRAVFHPQPSMAVPHAPASGISSGAVTAGDVPSMCGDVLRVQYGTLDAGALIKGAMGGLCRAQGGKALETATYTCAIPRPGLMAKKVKHSLHHGMPLGQVPLPPGGECQAIIASVAAKLRARWPDTVRLVLVLRCDASTPGEVVLCGAVTSPLWAKSIAAVTFAIESLKEVMPRMRHVARV